ncbi:unnamed protein product, partial [marine sediment metagenome]
RQDLKLQAALSRRLLIDGLLAARYVVWQRDGYRIRLKFREGELWLNGRPAGGSGPSPGAPAARILDSMAFAIPR